MYNALKQSVFVPAIDKLLNTVATQKKTNAEKIAVRCRRVLKFKCSIILSQSHGLPPAEWVAMRCHHAGLTQYDYRHFFDFMKSEIENYVRPSIQWYLKDFQAFHHMPESS